MSKVLRAMTIAIGRNYGHRKCIDKHCEIYRFESSCHTHQDYTELSLLQAMSGTANYSTLMHIDHRSYYMLIYIFPFTFSGRILSSNFRMSLLVCSAKLSVKIVCGRILAK